MREIKFRAWNKNNKEMYYLYGFIYTSDGEAELIHLAGEDVSNDFNIGDIEIMQFTGLKDKNGKEIYEGDIIKFIPSKGKATDVFDKLQLVEFNDGCFCVKDFLGTYQQMLCISKINAPVIFGHATIEVIGNIHENPELLNKEDA